MNLVQGNKIEEYDLIVIGGGSAGLAAAVEAYENGCTNILILEREKELGGILLQCIHNGFGLQNFKEELTGPAYAERYVEMLLKTGIHYKTDTMVIHLYGDHRVEFVNSQDGYVTVKGKAIILAMGCRERTRGAIAIPGYRPSGIWTAGTAQKYMNMEGYLVGKRVFILGSGDIGLIMARRMTLEGAKVLGVAELMPYSNGLPRNIKQCLEDFDIPLYLRHTITNIYGKDRLTGIELSEVDQQMKPIANTEKEFQVDTLLLSVGLIPENALSLQAGVLLHGKTKGPIVNESYETNIEGIFACGNVLHVHDLVDYVSAEGKKAGYFASKYVNRHRQKEKQVNRSISGDKLDPARDMVETKINTETEITIDAGSGIGYVVPQKIRIQEIENKQELLFRVTIPVKDAIIRILKDGISWKEIKKQQLAPSEMEKIILNKTDLKDVLKNITIEIV